jgi:tetratricopeptide (TPR) repeat protein
LATRDNFPGLRESASPKELPGIWSLDSRRPPALAELPNAAAIIPGELACLPYVNFILQLMALGAVKMTSDLAAAVEAQRNEYLTAHVAAKDALHKRLAFLAETLSPESGGAQAETAGLLATLQLIGEGHKINHDAIDPPTIALADQLSAEALANDELRAIAGNAAYQRGLTHMIAAYDPATNSNDPDQVANATHYVKAALEVGPQKSLYLCSLSQLSMQISDSESAYAYADAALKSDASNGEALRLKGNAAWVLGRNDEAESLLIDALRVAPYLDQTRETLAMVLTERAERDNLDAAELLRSHGVSLPPLSPDIVVQRIEAMTGPTEPDQHLYDSIIANNMPPRLTSDKHVVIDFAVEKKGLFSGKGRLRAHGICSDGSVFYLMSATDWTVFGGFLGTKLFAQLSVPAPQGRSRSPEDTLDAVVDFMFRMRDRLPLNM